MYRKNKKKETKDQPRNVNQARQNTNLRHGKPEMIENQAQQI